MTQEWPQRRRNASQQPPTSAQIRRRRNRFQRYQPPVRPMSTGKRPPIAGGLVPVPEDLAPLVSWFLDQESARERIRWVLRDSLDELLDGQRTGRWSYDHLAKTEKSHLGTVVEVNLTKEFDIPDGVDLDWRIQETDLDCKFSKDYGGWEIPMEMYLCPDHEGRAGKADHPALLVWMSDDTNEWAVGFISVTDERLRWKTSNNQARLRAYNRDNKRKLSDSSLADIHWLWGGLQNDLPPNTLLQMRRDIRDKIFSFSSSGQRRVDELFRCLPGVVVRRPVVLTVAQQDDAPKRARDARKNLRSSGIIVLGHQDCDPIIAQRLELPSCAKGEWLSVRLTPVGADDPRPKTHIGDRLWAVATDDDIPAPVPEIPKARAKWIELLNVQGNELSQVGPTAD